MKFNDTELRQLKMKPLDSYKERLNVYPEYKLKVAVGKCRIAGSRHETKNFIKIYFNFMYYFCTSPFRFVNSEGNKHSLRTWKPQQFACSISHILSIFVLLAEIRDVIHEDDSSISKKPSPYFRVALRFCILFYKINFMKRLWMNQSEYTDVLRCIEKETRLPYRKCMISSAPCCYAAYGFFLCVIVSCLVSGARFIDPLWAWNPSWYFRRVVAFARRVFYFAPKVKQGVAPEWSQICLEDWVLAVLMLFAWFQRLFLSFFCDMNILALTLTLWVTAHSFAKGIHEKITDFDGDSPKLEKNHAAEQWSEMFESFQAIRNLSGAINKALGSQVTLFMAEALMHYPINLNHIFIIQDNFTRFYTIVVCLVTFSILCTSADICVQIESIKLWLVKDKHSETIPFYQSNLVLHEMIVKDIGIRGNNVFTLTYSVVASFLSLIITFFIICVQDGQI